MAVHINQRSDTSTHLVVGVMALDRAMIVADDEVVGINTIIVVLGANQSIVLGGVLDGDIGNGLEHRHDLFSLLDHVFIIAIFLEK